MIHMAAFGPAVTLAVESTGGAEIARATFTLDLSTDTSSGTVPQVFDLTDGSGASRTRCSCPGVHQGLQRAVRH